MLTIITPPATIDLTTLSRFKSEPGMTIASDDSYIASLITTCSAAAATFCRRTFGRQTVSETFRPAPPSGGYCGWQPRPLKLSVFPVATVTSLVENGATLATTDYELDSESGLVTRLDASGNEIGWPRQLITVVYGAGWLLPGQAGTNLPADIERATLLMVRAAYLSRDRDPLVKSEALQGVLTTTFGAIGFGSSDLLPEAESLLSPYRVAVL